MFVVSGVFVNVVKYLETFYIRIVFFLVITLKFSCVNFYIWIFFMNCYSSAILKKLWLTSLFSEEFQICSLVILSESSFIAQGHLFYTLVLLLVFTLYSFIIGHLKCQLKSYLGKDSTVKALVKLQKSPALIQLIMKAKFLNATQLN